MEFNTGGPRGDVLAGTPPLVIIRLIISRAASRSGQKGLLCSYDITCAFLHATMDDEVFVVLPPGMAPDGYVALLLKALYGTRRASFLWGERVAEVMTSPAGGYARLR